LIVLVHPLFASPIPQELTESEFRSLRDEETPNNKVAIIDGYAKIRRQGRMLGGETIDFKRPLPVRVSFNGRGRTLFADSTQSNRQSRKFVRMDVGPVFNLEDMLRKEALKLKAQIQEASLKAAMAAEEAEKKLEEMVKQVKADATHEEVESIIEEAIESGIQEAEDIVEEDLMKEAEEENADEMDHSQQEEADEADNVVDDETDEESKNQDGAEIEPSGEIDLGSVQEV